MKEESLLLLSDLQKLINQVVLIDYTIIILGGDCMQINVSYITANDIMEILGVGRSKAYEIVRVMNEELENAGYNIIKGKVPVRYFQKKYYGCEMKME